jgi:thioredoxin:protein disulfide reductase
MHIRRLALFGLQFLFALVLATGGLLGGAARAAEDFLDPEVAFKLEARALDARTVEISYSIAPGYYLYREQFRFTADGTTLAPPVLPPGKAKFDETYQRTVETYRESVRVAIPVQQAASSFVLVATNQGCADKGLCYPPQARKIEVRLAGFGGDGSARLLSAAAAKSRIGGDAKPAAASTPLRIAPSASAAFAADDVGIDNALRSGKFWTVIGVFFVAGALLSLTPCVLPMLPILSSIIVGHGAQVSRGRGLALAASYSLGMALVYTALGVAAGLAGEGLAAMLQKPWVLVLFAAGLVTLALSMFGVYELQLPAALTGRLSTASHRLPTGRFAGVFAMGGVSALIVSPCVAAPLAGALVYLSQTGDVWLGGTALFSLAAGMSVPLLLMGASAGALLPRAGGWMEEIKRFFGMLLLGVALWMLQSVLPGALSLSLWGALVLTSAVMLVSGGDRHHAAQRTRLGRRAVASVIAVCGVLQLVGAASGGSNPLQPLLHLRPTAAVAESVADAGPTFTTVRNVMQLDDALRTAGRPVMLDFYADWCISCKEMERFTFTDPAVQKKMSGALLLKADVTANSDEDRELLKRFNLFGPPGTIFFDAQGRELPAARIAGFQDSTRFLQTLGIAGL